MIKQKNRSLDTPAKCKHFQWPGKMVCCCNAASVSCNMPMNVLFTQNSEYFLTS
jgi:hypothetical protein